MKTRTLVLSAAALAAGVIVSQAQTYSVNTVGYVNVTFPVGLSMMVCNPLNNTAGNNLSQIFPTAPNDTVVVRWSVANQDAGQVLQKVSGQWFDTGTSLPADPAIPPGEGIIVVNGGSGPWTNTFVGDVLQGNLTNPVQAPVGMAVLWGNMVPIGGNIPTVLGPNFTPADGDVVNLWTKTGGEDSDPNGVYQFTGGAWQPANPPSQINVAEGFIYVSNDNVNNPKSWNRSFTVQ